MTHEQFMKHWMEIHTPLALKVPGLRRYVQSHIQGERRRPDIPWLGVEVDGIAETWYADAMAPPSRPRDESAARRQGRLHPAASRALSSTSTL